MQNLQPITVAQVGLGSIGAEIARLMLKKRWIKVVAAIDTDPKMVGRDLAEIIGAPQPTGIRVMPELPGVPMVVVHSTESRLKDVEHQLLALLERGCHVVSTCEELSFPLDAAIRETLQVAARKANVTLLGTGVNPGFIMDKLPLTLTSVCQEVRSVSVSRVVDASLRREPLQRKVGAGMTVKSFEEAVRSGTIRHIGLRQSLMIIANGLNIELDSVSEEMVEPLIAEEKIVTEFLEVQRGEVAGLHQSIRGEKRGLLDLMLDIRLQVGARDAGDRVEIKGTPDIQMFIAGGVHGDRASAAMVVNAIPRVIAARPGLLTMDDIPISFR